MRIVERIEKSKQNNNIISDSVRRIIQKKSVSKDK